MPEKASGLVHEWSEALNNRDVKSIDSLLSRNGGLKYQQFFPRRKLPHYHSATYGPLLWAVWIEDFDIVGLLLKHGADPNHQSQSCLPLLLASRKMNRFSITGTTKTCHKAT